MLKNTLHKFLCLALALIFVVNLVGCSGSNDAETEVPLVLDSFMKAITKQVYEDYAKYSQTSVEAAQKDCETFINDFSEGVVGYEMDDETKEKYHAAFKKVLQNCKYEIGTATETSSKTYSVTITVQKLTIFANALEKANEDYIESLIEADYDVTDEEANKMFLECALTRIEEGLQAPSYGEAKTITITMVAADDDSGRYDLSDTDLGIIMAELADFSAWADDADEDTNLEAEAYEEILTDE